MFDRSSFFLADVDIFSAARTVVSFFLACDVDYFLLLEFLLVPGRKSGSGRVFTFPSDALLGWKLDFTLDVSLGSCYFFVAPVRRREDAEGDRDACVKVQVDDLSGENSSRMPFDVPKGRQEGVSCF